MFLLRDSGSTPRLCHLQVGWLFWGCWRRLLCGSLSPCNLNHIEGVGRTLPPGLSALLWSACRPQRGHPHVTNGLRPCLRVLTRTSPPGWRPAPSVLEPKAAPGSLPGSGLSRGRPLHIQAEPHDEGGRQDAPPGPSGPGSASHPLEDTPRPPPMDPAEPPPPALRRVPRSQERPSPTGGQPRAHPHEAHPFADCLPHALRTMGGRWRGSRREQPGWFCSHLKVAPFLTVNL